MTPVAPIVIAVVEAGSCLDEIALPAEQVGAGLAGHGAVLVCGGLGGVMEAVELALHLASTGREATA